MKYFLLAFITAFAFTSCNKEQTIAVPENRTDQLRAGNKSDASEGTKAKWKSAKYIVIFQNVEKKDSIVDNLYPQCLKDDYLEFYENFVGYHYTAGNKCATNDGERYKFRYEFTENEEYLHFYNADRFFENRTFMAKVKEFDASRFTLTYPKEWVVNGILDTVTVENTLEKY